MTSRPILNADATVLILPIGERVPWDAANNRPVDYACEAGRKWEAAKEEFGITEPDPYVAHPEPVPSIDRRQCRLWLLANGKTREDVETAIAAIVDQVQREAARIEWEDAKVFQHDHPLMLALAPALGIPAETLPYAFRAAALL